MTDGIHEEERQSDVDGAGQRQQDTEDDTQTVCAGLLRKRRERKTPSSASRSNSTANQRGIQSTSLYRTEHVDHVREPF